MKKRIIILAICMMLVFGMVTPALAISSDNPKVQWLINRGWVEGRGEPVGLALKENITRAEFTKMVVVISGGETRAKDKADLLSPYGDVPKTHWANGYVNEARAQGYIKGYEDGSFRPEDRIKYDEVVAILARIHPCFKEEEVTGLAWAKQYIEFAEAAKILEGVTIPDRDFTHIAIREKTFELVYNSYHSPKECDKIDIGKYYNVRFYVDGKVYEETRVKKGEKLQKPKPPVKEGFKFVIWEDFDGKVYDFEKAVNSDLTLRARFLVNEPLPVRSLRIIAKPSKLEYKVGERLDIRGLVIDAVFNDDTIREIPIKDLLIVPADGAEITKDMTKIVVTYMDKTVEIPIVVKP